MDDLLAKKSFVQWIKGECPPEEKEYWDAWLQDDPEHRLQAEQAKEIITALEGEFEIPDPEVELSKLDRIIDQYENRTEHRVNNYKYLYKRSRGAVAAGILFLIVLMGSIYTSWNYSGEREEPEIAEVAQVQEYQTEYGEKLTFRLSDGSKIILNSNSHLKFSSKIEKGLNTEVWLEGEAYFNIAHLEDDQQRTFAVHTGNGSVKVLGTRFSVNTFGNKTRTVLEEGSISIGIENEADNSLREYELEPGEMARFVAQDNKIAIQQVNTRIYTSWIEDKFVFKNTPMEEVKQRIEDTYGLEVILEERFAKEMLSGSIKNDNLDVLTEALAEIMDVTIKKKDQKLIIGTED